MSEHSQHLMRYKHLRERAREVNKRLVQTLPRDIIDEGGKKLGILNGNVLKLDTQDMITVLMDFCIYDVRRQGLNAIERFLAKSPPPPGSDDMVILQGMRQARFTMVLLESTEPGVGVSRSRPVLRRASVPHGCLLQSIGPSRPAPGHPIDQPGRPLTNERCLPSRRAAAPGAASELHAKPGGRLAVLGLQAPFSGGFEPSVRHDHPHLPERGCGRAHQVHGAETGLAERPAWRNPVRRSDPGIGPLPRGRARLAAMIAAPAAAARNSSTAA